MSNQSDTPETDAALYPMNGVDIVWPEFARSMERERDEARETIAATLRSWQTAQEKIIAVTKERDELKAMITKEQGVVTISKNGYVQELERERDEACADAIRWQSIAEGRGRTDETLSK